jgi:ATP-dependent Zn protease
LTSLGGSFIGGINLAQSCGGNSKCYGSQTDPNTGQTTTSEVDCSNSAAAIDQNVQNLKASLAKKAESTSNLWAVLVVLISFGILIIIWLFFVTRGVPEKDLTFSRNVINTSKNVQKSVQFNPRVNLKISQSMRRF